MLENPDPTSGNFLEQIPKTLLLVLAFLLMVERPGLDTVVAVEGFILALGVVALLVHQWFFTWPPAPSLTPTRLVAQEGQHRCKRFIAIVIDGCRADRLLEADTPFIDRMRRQGVDYFDTSTVCPARTVTGFSSMFTGAPSRTHGMRSNFVPSLGVKCESIFDSLRASGMNGKLVGIAHLVDAFGDDVETVTVVTHNDEIDDALVARAKAVMERGNPDLLALQLLSVNQTGHARGSYNAIFYLSTVRYIGITQQDVADGKDHGTHQVEAFAFYQSIQPEVAQADSSADETIMAYLTADAGEITPASRDAALAALNGVASALLLTQDDLVTGY